MRSRPRPPRRRPGIESLEGRSLLSSVDPGLWPLANPGPSNSLLIRFRATATEATRRATLEPLRAAVITDYPDGPELIRVGQGIAVDAALRSLTANPEILYAEADSVIHASSVPLFPNDANFGTSFPALTNSLDATPRIIQLGLKASF